MKNFAKKTLKSFFKLLCLILALPVYLVYLLTGLLLDKDKNIQAYSQFYSLLPGICGEYLRLGFYRLSLKKCSSECCISFGTLFSTADVEIGNSVYIGPYCVIGHARIQDDVLIASRVSLLSGLKQHGTKSTKVLIRKQTRRFEVIQVEKDSWIGEGAVVGAHIRKKSVIAAGAVVFKEVAPYSVVAGNPAKRVKKRK